MTGDFIQWKNGNAYFRRKVPKALQVVVRRAEWSQALGTGDKQLAKERARILERRTDDAIAQARRQLEGRPLEEAETREFAELEYRQERSMGRAALQRAGRLEDWAPGDRMVVPAVATLGDLARELEGTSPSDLLLQEEMRSAHLAALVSARRLGDYRLMEPFADALFQEKGLTQQIPADLSGAGEQFDCEPPSEPVIDRSRRDYQTLCKQLLEQHIKAAKETLLDLQRAKLGLPDGSPRAVLVPVKADEAVEQLRDEARETPLALFDRFTRDSEGRRGASMLRTVEAALHLLAEVTGTRGVAQITEKDIAVFHDLVSECPARHKLLLGTSTMREAIIENEARGHPLQRNTRATVAKHISALKTFFKWAVSRRFALASPVSGLTVDGGHASSTSREGFNADELRRLFDHAVFQVEPPARDHRFWVPYLALYTAGRLAELCQLAVADVREKDGIAWIEITNRGEGQSLKSAAGRRIVPLHADLIALGFLTYWRERQSAGDGRLFPSAPRGAEGRNPYNPVSQWFTRLLGKAGVRRPGLSFHSFRHTWNEAARQSGIAKEMREALMGHANGTVNDEYGGTFGLEARAAAIRIWKIEFRKTVEMEPATAPH